MTLEYRRGDILAQPGSFAHGCNTSGVMGAGLALQVRQRWPDLFLAYQAKCREGVFRLGDAWLWVDDEIPPRLIWCLGTQPRPGPCATLAAVSLATQNMLALARRLGSTSIAIPRIGCGLGGLDWRDVEPIVRELSDAFEVPLVVYER